jgi:hypothetical protein
MKIRLVIKCYYCYSLGYHWLHHVVNCMMNAYVNKIRMLLSMSGILGLLVAHHVKIFSRHVDILMAITQYVEKFDFLFIINEFKSSNRTWTQVCRRTRVVVHLEMVLLLSRPVRRPQFPRLWPQAEFPRRMAGCGRQFALIMDCRRPSQWTRSSQRSHCLRDGQWCVIQRITMVVAAS